MKSSVYTGLFVLMTVTNGTNPWDSFVPFDGFELDDDQGMELGTPETTPQTVPPETTVPTTTETSTSTHFVQTDSSANASANSHEDWCYEYDEIRFRLDASAIAINAEESHKQLLSNLAMNTLNFLNTRLRSLNQVPYQFNQLGALSASGNLTAKMYAPVVRMIDYLDNTIGCTRDEIAKMFRSVLYQDGLTTNENRTILIARLIIGFGILRKKSAARLDQHVKIKNNLLKQIFDNEDSIRTCLERRIIGADTILSRLEKRRANENFAQLRYEPIRRMIVESIQEHSVPAAARDSVSSEIRMECLQSAREVMFEGVYDPRRTSLSLAQFLKKSLKRKNLNFLSAWLEVWDALHEEHTKLIDRIENLTTRWNYAKIIAQKMTGQLSQDTAEALMSLSPSSDTQ